IRRRCGRTMTQSRRMSRWSYAFPKISSSVCGGLDMAPALPPPCSSARRRRAASAACPSRLLICSVPRASTWPPHSPRLAPHRAPGAPPLRPVLPGCSSAQSHAPRHGPRTPPALSLGAPMARRFCARYFSVGHFLVPTCRRLLIGELLLDLLDAPETSVEAAGLEELSVRALLHQPPLVEDDNLVGLLGNPQPMRHDERAASRHCRAKRAEDLGLLAGIDRGEDVVEDEDGRLRHERAGERDALPLAAREGETALADHRLPAFGKALDLRAEPRRLRSRAKPYFGRQLIAEGHVVADGAREEEGLLRHVAHGAPQARTRKIAHIDSAHEDGAGRRLVETAHQRAQR